MIAICADAAPQEQNEDMPCPSPLGDTIQVVPSPVLLGSSFIIPQSRTQKQVDAEEIVLESTQQHENQVIALQQQIMQ